MPCLFTQKEVGLGEGSDVRPKHFPEEFWPLVHPDQRKLVAGRFELFKTEEYLEECIKKVVEKLDIGEVHGPTSTSWHAGEEAESKYLRAQALANLDAYFPTDPDEVGMARDLVASIPTVDDKAFKARPRKFSVVMQAFLTAKTGFMLQKKQLEHAKSNWCHGLVLVPYEERINAFMEAQGDEAMEKMFLPEHAEEVATFFRLCIDLRMLNKKTIPDLFPLPRIDDLLESIPRGCDRFSISDICDAFFKCKVAEEDRHKTAFKTHDKQLRCSLQFCRRGS